MRKKIWFLTKRHDLETDPDVDIATADASFVEVEDGEEGETVRGKILVSCDLCGQDELVLKMRNHRGSLMPICGSLTANSYARPYLLEVVKQHQNVKASPRTVKILGYNETMKDKLQDVVQRLELLETAAPELSKRRNTKINKEMREQQQMLQFLTTRVCGAESAKWKGMFKKNPLW